MNLPLPRWVLGVLAVVALVVGIDNLDRPLANPDEGRYSEISREMVASGDWVTPHLNGLKYFEKPPLQYWATAAAFKLFGENETSARLYVGLCGLATILIIGFAGMRLLNPEAGLAAMLVLVSSPYFLALGRFLTQSHRRVEPAWYFVPVLAVGFLPWVFALPSAIAQAWRSEASARGPQPVRLLLAYSAFVVVFFSASGSKLPAYILPAFPPLALAIGRYLAQAPPRRLALWAALTIPIGIALAAVAWHLPDTTRDEWTRRAYEDAWGIAFAGALLLVVSSAGATVLLRAGLRWAAIAVVALANVLMIDCIEDVYENLSPRQSGFIVAEKMRPLLKPTTRLYSVSHYEQTVPFYIARTMTLVDYEDEFQLGISIEPERAIETRAEFPEQWLRPGDALAIMHPKAYEELKALGLPMQVVHEDPRRILVRKP